MSDRTDQTIKNLAYEVRAIAVDQLAFYQRLHQLKAELVSEIDVQTAERRLKRLSSLVKALQRSAEKD